MLNQARLKVLKAQDDHTKDILEEAKRRLQAVGKDKSKSTNLIEGLIVEVKSSFSFLNVIAC